MRYRLNMVLRHTALAFIAASVLSACSTIAMPDVDFMGNSDFSEEVSALQPSFPSPDEAPDIPNDVRSAAEWDKSARDMQALQGTINAPDLEPGLTPEEFDREFDAAIAAAQAYKKDDPS